MINGQGLLEAALLDAEHDSAASSTDSDVLVAAAAVAGRQMGRLLPLAFQASARMKWGLEF